MESNQNPEQRARDTTYSLLIAAGWKIQRRNAVNWNAGPGIAILEHPTDVGPADYVLFVDKKPVGVVEAKREDEGYHLIHRLPRSQAALARALQLSPPGDPPGVAEGG